jgi:pSer/pThr/pTyr-binding forkhead associated (FHA) protein
LSSPLIFRIFKGQQLVGIKQFSQDQIVIGHDADVNIDLDSEDVSPIHCLIENREGRFHICDLGSKSGTFKNGQAVLDEAIVSGDELTIGAFKINFFVGVPKPQSKPVVIDEPPKSMVAETPEVKEPEIKKSEVLPVPVEVLPEAVTLDLPVTPVLPVFPMPPIPSVPSTLAVGPLRPLIRSVVTENKKSKYEKTFAPPSEISDLKTFLKPGKGTSVQVLVAWNERILTTYNFEERQVIKVNSGEGKEIALPVGLLPTNFPILDLTNGLRVNITSEMFAEMVYSSGVLSLEELLRNSKAVKTGLGYSVRIDQNEMLSLKLPGELITLYIRFIPKAPIVPMLPPLMLSASEISGLVISGVMVGLLALYVSATTPKDWQENKQEEVQRLVQVVFTKPPAPPPPPPPLPEPKEPQTPPPKKIEKPPPPPPPKEKKVIVSNDNKEAHRKGPPDAADKNIQVQAKASEVAPKPLAKDMTKKFTSTRQGGAVKIGKVAGANAASANKDVSKVGLFAAFGRGGVRDNMDKAYSGAGGVLGAANSATGTSGFNEDRAGKDLGSRFKDSGAGGKGTATEGIRDVGTKGRSEGKSDYGASVGYGSKNSVAIAGGGFEESFDATIDKEAIRRVIKARINEIKSCYERALNTLEKGRKLEGKIVLGWDIVEKGQARNVKIVSSTLGNTQVEHCIRDRLASWVFPEPPTGLTAVVKAYPFILNQQN